MAYDQKIRELGSLWVRKINARQIICE